MRLRHCGRPGDFRIAFPADRAVGRDASQFLRAACGPHGCSGLLYVPCWAGLLVLPRVFRAPQGPVAREARDSLRSAPRLEARPCPPVPPAPSTPVGLGRCSAALRVVSKPGQAPPPPTGTAATSDECGDTLLASTSTRLKPPAPLHGQTVATLKPAAPLLTTFSLFERVSRSQRRCRFHSAAHIRSQRCHRFHSDGVRCPTRQNSPSALKTAQNEWFLSSRANFFAKIPLKGQRWANYVAECSEGNMSGEFCRAVSQAHPLRRERHSGVKGQKVCPESRIFTD